jgi:hypothetical protein
MCISSRNRKRSIALENLTATVEENGVHTHRTQGVACPPRFDVHDEEIKGQEQISKTTLEEDEGKTPQILVHWHNASFFAEAAQTGSNEAFDNSPHPQSQQPPLHILVMNKHPPANYAQPHEERGVESSNEAFGIIKYTAVHVATGRPMVKVVFTKQQSIDVAV